jgi:predicted DNA-binding ribbon-helix-helix protein
MCEFFVKADPIAYEQRSRTVRIHGVLTSIRLENMMWDTLAEMAAEEGRTTAVRQRTA